MIPPLLIAFIGYAILGNKTIPFDATLWFPFDTNTPIGFFVGLLFQSVSVCAELCFAAPIGCVFIGTCWFIVTILKDISKDISTLKEKRIASMNEKELSERICNFVRSHADVEELSVDN